MLYSFLRSCSMFSPVQHWILDEKHVGCHRDAQQFCLNSPLKRGLSKPHHLWHSTAQAIALHTGGQLGGGPGGGTGSRERFGDGREEDQEARRTGTEGLEVGLERDRGMDGQARRVWRLAGTETRRPGGQVPRIRWMAWRPDGVVQRVQSETLGRKVRRWTCCGYRSRFSCGHSSVEQFWQSPSVEGSLLKGLSPTSQPAVSKKQAPQS